ncbi:MAG: 50S ribosomal protein L22 [Bacteroidota bacterium]
MEARAVRKYIRTSPLKMRTVVNVVRGKNVGEALSILNFLPQQATRQVRLAIESAVHNLMNKYEDERFDEDELVISEIRVDEGPTIKRFQPAPRGRAHRILKRSCHLTVVIAAPGEEDEDDE